MIFSRKRFVSTKNYLCILLGIFQGFFVVGYEGSSAYAEIFNPREMILANGMQVIVVPNHNAPVVSHMIWYDAGAHDAPEERQSGAAHFLEHMMFRGTDNLADGEYSRVIDGLGGQSNAFTSGDYTAYFANVEASFLPEIMAMEADRMRGVQLSPELVATERQVVLEERRQRVDNHPASLLQEKMRKALYGDEPSGWPVIGWAADIPTLDVEDLQRFYDSHYVPHRAVLIVTGDVVPEEVFALAQHYYGGIASPRTDMSENVAVQELAVEEGGEEQATSPFAEAGDIVTRSIQEVVDPLVAQPLWLRYYLAPSYTSTPYESIEDRQAHAAQILQEILDRGINGILYEKLVRHSELASDVSVYYDPFDDREAIFAISVVPRPGISFADIESALEEILVDLPAHIDQNMFETAQESLLIQAVYARDSLMAPAYIFGQALTTGASIAHVENWPDHISAVMLTDVQQLATRLFVPGRYVTGYLSSESSLVP